jgi:hypothetical protein
MCNKIKRWAHVCNNRQSQRKIQKQRIVAGILYINQWHQAGCSSFSSSCHVSLFLSQVRFPEKGRRQMSVCRRFIRNVLRKDNCERGYAASGKRVWTVTHIQRDPPALGGHVEGWSHVKALCWSWVDSGCVVVLMTVSPCSTSNPSQSCSIHRRNGRLWGDQWRGWLTSTEWASLSSCVLHTSYTVSALWCVLMWERKTFIPNACWLLSACPWWCWLSPWRPLTSQPRLLLLLINPCATLLAGQMDHWLHAPPHSRLRSSLPVFQAQPERGWSTAVPWQLASYSKQTHSWPKSDFSFHLSWS